MYRESISVHCQSDTGRHPAAAVGDAQQLLAAAETGDDELVHGAGVAGQPHAEGFAYVGVGSFREPEASPPKRYASP